MARLARQLLVLFIGLSICGLSFFNQGTAADDKTINVHIVCHTHDDAGWLKTADQYYYGARQDIQFAGVQYILDTVVQCLLDDPSRTFTYAEMAFFTQWWREQSDSMKEKVRQLVAEGRLGFVNGGWVQHDEAAAHYVAMIDQTTRGHAFLLSAFNYTPTVAWQIDPFGHSATQASLLTAAVGMDAVFFARADYDDLARRKAAAQSDFVWRPSGASFGDAADVFAGNFPNHYGPPSGFNFEWGQHDPPIIDDPTCPDYNLDERVELFVKAAKEYATTALGNDVMFLMGTDFTYASAQVWYKNLDKLIRNVNAANLGVKASYSSPQRYVAAKHAYNLSWPLKTDDLFPYADNPHTYWTGYFSSRPTSKAFIRSATSYLSAARQVLALRALHPACPQAQAAVDALDALEAAVSLTQHHDAISGTAKQHVADDYARRIHTALESARKLVAASISQLIFSPTTCEKSVTTRARARGRAPGEVAVRSGAGGEGEGRVSSPPLPDGTPGDDEAVTAPPLPEAAGAVTAPPLPDGQPGDDSAVTAPPLPGRALQADAISESRRGGPQFERTQDSAQSDLEYSTPELVECPLSNVTICEAVTSATQACKPLVLVLYNPVAWTRTDGVRVPLGRATDGKPCNYMVADSHGVAVEAVAVPVPQSTVCLQALLLEVNATTSPGAPAELMFSAEVPPLGFATYLLHPKARPSQGPSVSQLAPVTTHISLPNLPEHSCDACRDALAIAAARGGQAPHVAGALPSSAAAVRDSPIVIDNDELALEFSPLTGRLETITLKRDSTKVRTIIDFVYFESLDQEPYGGAYIMRPGRQVPLTWANGSLPAAVEVVKTSVVSEVRQAFSKWGTLVTRLWRGGGGVELEWTVGPVPIGDNIGKEVMLRVFTDIDSGDEFRTDSNGREMLLRRRNFRPSWPLNNTEPVAGNFYPITAAISISGRTPSSRSDLEMTLVTDRAQAASSLEPGGMHVLLHRRLLRDDSRGVDEFLNETMCGCNGPSCACPGLVARGTFRLLLDAAPDAALKRRTAQKLTNDPLLAFYTPGEAVMAWAARKMRQTSWMRKAPAPGDADEPNASHPLATAILRQLGDYGVVPAQLKAIGDNGLVVAQSRSGVEMLRRVSSAESAISSPPLPESPASTMMRLSWSPFYSSQAPSSKALRHGLSNEVEVLTLMPWPTPPPAGGAGPPAGARSFLLRLSHLYQAGTAYENGARAQVDLCALFASQSLVTVTEMTLSANRRLSELSRREFKSDRVPICFKPDSAACDPPTARPAPRKYPPLEVAGACPSLNATVVLEPMVIRTFVITLAPAA